MDSLTQIEMTRAEAAWDALPGEVRAALKRRMSQVHTLTMIEEIGTRFQNGARSIAPHPGTSTFGPLGLMGCRHILDRLSAI